MCSVGERSYLFGGAKREGTAVVVGAGLVVDVRALLLSVVVMGGGAFED